MKEEIKQGFIRQRRNLILVCLILVFIEGANVSLTSLNIFGNTLNISDPSMVNLSFWLAFIYFLLRYYQYFNDIEDKGIKTSYFNKMEKLVSLVAVKNYIKNEDLSKFFPDIESKPKITLHESNITINNPKQWQMGISVNAYAKDAKHQHGHTRTGIGTQTVEGKDLIFPKISTWFHIIFNTRYFTEYFFPFLLAIFVITGKIILWLNT